MTRRQLVAAMFAALHLSCAAAFAETKIEKLPRLPGATLLIEYPPGDLTLTTGSRTLDTGGGYWFAEPGMSPDGHLVAAARTVTPTPILPRAPQCSIVRIYSTLDRKWTDTRLTVTVHAVALSPDGSRLACISRGTLESPSRIQVMDLRDGTLKRGPHVKNNYGGPIYLSWGPDGRRIIFNQTIGESPIENPAIYILDVDVGTVSKVADGTAPAWSPSGDWIVLNDFEPGGEIMHGSNTNRVSVIRPNGSDHKTLVTFPKDEALITAPVWSPDSTRVLINRPRYDLSAWPTWNIYILELATRKLTRKFPNSPRVLAWVKAN